MSGNLITVAVMGGIALRNEINGSKKFVELDTFYTPDENGVLVPNYFLNESNENSALIIDGQRIFNKNSTVDQHNLRLIEKYLKAFPKEANEISIMDPEFDMNKELELSTLSFEIEKYLRENEKNVPLLSKLYRRVVGQVNGISGRHIFATLVKLSKDEPNRFLHGSNKVYEDGTFETFALIDVCIEKGLMALDKEGAIRDRDNRIIGLDIEKVAFFLDSNPEDKDAYERLSQQVDKPLLRSEPAPEFSSYVNLSDQDKAKEQVEIFGKMNSEQFKIELEKNLKPMIEAGFVIKSGELSLTKYQIYQVEHEPFSKSQLVAYFEKNLEQYQDLKTRSSI